MAPDPDELVRDVGRRIAEIRRVLGLTQEQMAERMGMPPRAYQVIEYGRRNLTLKTIARLAGALGVAPADLFQTPAPFKRKRGRPARAS